MPTMMNTGSTGKLKEATVPSNTTSEARGTPANPLVVSIKVSTIRICWPQVIEMPAACATKMVANDK